MDNFSVYLNILGTYLIKKLKFLQLKVEIPFEILNNISIIDKEFNN